MGEDIFDNKNKLFFFLKEYFFRSDYCGGFFFGKFCPETPDGFAYNSSYFISFYSEPYFGGNDSEPERAAAVLAYYQGNFFSSYSFACFKKPFNFSGI